jgi:excisionase family DNA binding protein
MSTEAKQAKTPKRTSPDLLDYKQVADRLNCSDASVRRLVDAGKLKTVPVTPSGRRRMVRLVDLQSYLEDNAGYRPAPEPARDTRRTMTEDLAMRKAGWSGKDHLEYERKPRK